MEKNNYRLIPFDIKRAKTPSNPDVLDVVAGGKNVRIICTDRRSGKYNIVALIYNRILDDEDIFSYDEHGVGATNHRLFLKEPVMPRRMTNKELSMWLRDCPEEYREVKCHITVFSYHSYFEDYANEPVNEDIKIRSNYGEWHEPLVDAN